MRRAMSDAPHPLQHRYDVATTIGFGVAAVALLIWAYRVADPPIGVGRTFGVLLIVAGVFAVHFIYADLSAPRDAADDEARARSNLRLPEWARLRLEWRPVFVVVRLALLAPFVILVYQAKEERDVRQSDLARIEGTPVRSKIVDCAYVTVNAGCWSAPVVTLRLANDPGGTDSIVVFLGDRGLSRDVGAALLARVRIGAPATAWTLHPHGFPGSVQALAYEFVQSADTLVDFESRVAYDREVRAGDSGEELVFAAIGACIMMLIGLAQASIRRAAGPRRAPVQG